MPTPPTRSATALAGLTGIERRARTDRIGQYHLDTVADAAVLPVLNALPVRVLSEESAWSGQDDAEITVVVDPVDGSTNCSRGIPYWGISLCALDADGPQCALVENGATGARYTAVRGQGAWLDGERLARLRGHRDGPGRGGHRRHAPVRAARGASSGRSVRPRSGSATWPPAGSTGSSTAPSTRTARGTTSVACSCAARAARTSPMRATATSTSPIPSLAVSRWPRARPSCSRRCARGPVVNLDLDHLLTVAVDAAVAAGSIVRDGFAAPQNVREKHPGDLVSDTDVASERSIRDRARAGGAGDRVLR